MNRSGVLIYGDERIPYAINEVATRTSRVAIHVDPDGSVVVDTPPGEDDTRVSRAVQRRARWIASNVAQAHDRHRHVRPKEYVSGEQILYLGRRYVLKVIPDPDDPGSARLRGNRLEVRLANPTTGNVKVLMQMWYRDRATDYFQRRIAVQSQALPWVAEAPKFRLLEMTRQWGNCSPEGLITLNPHLVKAPRDCIDYVIVHELAHLRHHDHGADFWNLIKRSCPSWEQAKQRLDISVEELTAT